MKTIPRSKGLENVRKSTMTTCVCVCFMHRCVYLLCMCVWLLSPTSFHINSIPSRAPKGMQYSTLPYVTDVKGRPFIPLTFLLELFWRQILRLRYSAFRAGEGGSQKFRRDRETEEGRKRSSEILIWWLMWYVYFRNIIEGVDQSMHNKYIYLKSVLFKFGNDLSQPLI